MTHNNFFEPVKDHKNLSINKDSQIDYSDGEIENYILQCVSTYHSAEPYADWEKLIVDWPTEYHLSWVRTNILAPLKFQPHHRVLELGGGTGILTHFMASRVKEVISYEGSLQRGKCIATRCAMFNNVQTVVSNFKDVDFVSLYGERSFDVITLIGVLEYANKYYGSPGGIKALLDDCYRLLKPDGVLVIAIENRLGLKYLLGWEEDHFGSPYYGVKNLYRENEVVTYGYTELAEILKASSFHNHRFLFPFPDYKLPGVILSPLNRSLSLAQQNLYSNLLHKNEFRNYSGSPSPVMNASRAVKSIISNDLLFDLSNSFLVLASHSDIKNNLNVAPANTVAGYFSSSRKYDYANTITFYEEDDSIFYIKKKIGPVRINHDPVEAVLKLNEYDCKAKQIKEGMSLAEILEDACLKNDIAAFESYLRKWIEFLESKIPGHLFCEFDLMPFNIIIDADHRLNIIDDTEWTCAFSFTLEQAVTRFFMLNPYYAQFLSGKNANVDLALLNTLLSKYHLSPISASQYQNIVKLHKFSSCAIMADDYTKTTPLKKGALSRTGKLTLLSKKLLSRLAENTVNSGH